MSPLEPAVAFAAGLVSITSPCCLPLLPGYLGYLTGFSASQLEADRRRPLTAAALFVAGFSLVFVALGATASELGALLLAYRLPLVQVAGVFILAMGLLLLLEGRIGLLSRGGDWSRWLAGGRLSTAPLLGAAFAITWTPCIGPVLAAVLTLAGSTADLTRGVVLLAAYSLGLGIPFLALALSLHRVRGWLHGLGWAGVVLQRVSGLDRWLQVVAPVLAWYAQARWPPI